MLIGQYSIPVLKYTKHLFTCQGLYPLAEMWHLMNITNKNILVIFNRF